MSNHRNSTTAPASSTRTDVEQARLKAMLNLEGSISDLVHMSVLVDYFVFDTIGKADTKDSNENSTVTIANYEIDAILFGVGEVHRRANALREQWRRGWAGKAVSE